MLSFHIGCMKRGELHHDLHMVTFLTDRVVMTPKQHRTILVGDDRARSIGIICETCKEMIFGYRNRICTNTNRECTSPVLKCGV